MGEPQGERPLVQASGLVKRYGFRAVLRGLDFAVPPGQSVALMGANGAGKSTLLRLMVGLSRPDGGSLTVGGWTMPYEAAHVRAHLGFVAHKPLLYDGLTARENLVFFGQLYGLGGADLDQRAEELLALVGLKKRAFDTVRGFSRGMLQRLSIARALLHRPDLLLLDEPFTGLDLTGTALLETLITDARTAGHTVLIATHDPAHALALADRVVVLSKGVVALDSPTSVFGSPSALAAAYDALG